MKTGDVLSQAFSRKPFLWINSDAPKFPVIPIKVKYAAGAYIAAYRSLLAAGLYLVFSRVSERKKCTIKLVKKIFPMCDQRYQNQIFSPGAS